MKMMNCHCGASPVVEGRCSAHWDGDVACIHSPVRKLMINDIGGMTMRTIFSILLIMGLVQTTVSVWAEPQDLTVTPVMKGSTTISGQEIEYPKTDKAEM